MHYQFLGAVTDSVREMPYSEVHLDSDPDFLEMILPDAPYLRWVLRKPSFSGNIARHILHCEGNCLRMVERRLDLLDLYRGPEYSH